VDAFFEFVTGTEWRGIYFQEFQKSPEQAVMEIRSQIYAFSIRHMPKEELVNFPIFWLLVDSLAKQFTSDNRKRPASSSLDGMPHPKKKSLATITPGDLRAFSIIDEFL
jgi:hypothetical protein